jgi:hypothetical protein
MYLITYIKLDADPETLFARNLPVEPDLTF